jgi:hypothetical protein
LRNRDESASELWSKSTYYVRLFAERNVRSRREPCVDFADLVLVPFALLEVELLRAPGESEGAPPIAA